MSAVQKTFPAEPASEAFAGLSALLDGEASAMDFDALLASGDGPEVNARWHSYQIVGEVLRGGEPTVGVSEPHSFLTGVMAALQEVPRTAPRLQVGASVSHVRAPAANDAVMRWKMVAGFASLAAVMAVSWGVLQGVDGAASDPAARGAQLAVAEPAQTMALAQPVVVNTEQGTLIRDARLEQLLAEHRQYGGATALQMPAGFLRNATYGTAPQR